MNEIVYTEGFLEDMLQVTSSRVEEAVFDAIDLLPYAPVLGSRSLPDSLSRRYGGNVRKMAVSPFDVVYRITDDGDFLILGLVHMRAAR